MASIFVSDQQKLMLQRGLRKPGTVTTTGEKNRLRRLENRTPALVKRTGIYGEVVTYVTTEAGKDLLGGRL